MSRKAYIYMLRCLDNSIYTGITTDVERRMQEHKGRGKEGARYTRAHPFLRLEAVFEASDWSQAARLEYAIKHLKKTQKEALIQNPQQVNKMFAQKLSGCLFFPHIVQCEYIETTEKPVCNDRWNEFK